MTGSTPVLYTGSTLVLADFMLVGPIMRYSDF